MCHVNINKLCTNLIYNSSKVVVRIISRTKENHKINKKIKIITKKKYNTYNNNNNLISVNKAMRLEFKKNIEKCF